MSWNGCRVLSASPFADRLPAASSGAGAILVRVLVASRLTSPGWAWFPCPASWAESRYRSRGTSAPPDLAGGRSSRAARDRRVVTALASAACWTCLRSGQVRKSVRALNRSPRLLGGSRIVPAARRVLLTDAISDAEAAPVSCGVATIAGRHRGGRHRTGRCGRGAGSRPPGGSSGRDGPARPGGDVVAGERVPSRQALARAVRASSYGARPHCARRGRARRRRALRYAASRGRVMSSIETCGVPVALLKV